MSTGGMAGAGASVLGEHPTNPGQAEPVISRDLMQFVQVGMLGALAALSIPIIIHLLFRHRARVVELGTLQFLKVVLRQDARRDCGFLQA